MCRAPVTSLWIRPIAEAICASVQLEGTSLIDWRYSPAEESTWGVNLLEFAPAVIEIVDSKSKKAKQMHLAINKLDLLEVQKQFDEITALDFGLEDSGGPRLIAEGSVNGNDLMVSIYSGPFNDAKIHTTIKDGALHEKAP